MSVLVPLQKNAVSNTTNQCTLVAGPKLREYNKPYPSWKIVGPITQISKGNFSKGRELNFVHLSKFFIETTVIPKILGGWDRSSTSFQMLSVAIGWQMYDVDK